MNTTHPKVFISYSWDNEIHKKWVLKLADKLCEKGVDVLFDQYETRPGKDFIHFMESSLSNSEYVLMILTPLYKTKTDNRTKGAGYEFTMVTADFYENQQTEKFIPILKDGEKDSSTPLFLKSRIDIDMRDDSLFEEKFVELLRTIYKDPKIKKPELGEKPDFTKSIPAEIENNLSNPNINERKKKTEIGDDLKGYSEIAKILQLSHPNAQFVEDRSFLDKTKKIGYSLFKRIDKLVNQDIYYLYLYKGIIQSATLASLKNRCAEFNDRNEKFIILIPREEVQINPETRKKNIIEKFKRQSVYYIDEFIWEFCTPEGFKDIVDSKLLNIDNFVTPRVQNEWGDEKKFDDLTNWLSVPNEQVLVLRGNGGIGKTTVARYIADFFQFGIENVQKQKKSLFIESSEILYELERTQKTDEELNIYSFYEADLSKNEDYQNKLDDVQFKVNLDNGNLLVVIDGLDEIISKVSNFDVNIFLNSIFDLYNEIGNAKVIITCRNHFWDNSKINDNFQLKVVELLPFDEPQARKFFDSSFNYEIKKTDKCIKIAKEFISKTDVSEIFEYQPYVLDVIKNIVDSGGNVMKKDTNFFSKYLTQDCTSDYIIYNVCRRENEKIKQISVDKQIEIFMKLSIKYEGIIPESKLSQIIQEDSSIIDESKIETLKSHPFITTSNNRCVIKYDFFTDIFKSIYVKSILNIDNAEPITEDVVRLMSNNCSLNSNLTREVANRVKFFSDNEILKIVEIISAIKKIELKNNVKVKAISGLFAIALRILHDRNKTNIEYNTKLLVDIFEINNCIQDLCIVNFSSYDLPLVFDFSNKTFNHCHFDNFSDFWSCTFNDNTLFTDCTLSNLHCDPNKIISIKDSQLVNCKKDSTIEEVFKNMQLSEQNIEAKIQSFLKSFFKIFIDTGRVVPRSLKPKSDSGRYKGNNDIKSKYKKISPSYFELEELLKILFERKILSDYEFKDDKAKSYKISDSYVMDVTKFCNEGTQSEKIIDIVRLLVENIN